MGQNLLILAVLIVFAIVIILSRRSPNRSNGNGGGGRQWQAPRPRRNGGGQWKVSQNGNPTMVVGGQQITVFAYDDEVVTSMDAWPPPLNSAVIRGWKYCIADEGDDDDPYYSDPYETEEAAKYEALAFINGSPSRHRSLTERRREAWREYRRQQRLKRWGKAIQEREQLIADISDLLTRDDLNITALRKPEAKIASRLKALGWQISEYHADGVRKEAIAQAEMQKITLRELAQRVEARITERKAKRKSPSQK